MRLIKYIYNVKHLFKLTMKVEINLFYGYDNRVYAKEEAEEIRKYYVPGKLSEEQWINYIGYHVEAGNSYFEDCANAVIHELGENAAPEIKDAYLTFLDKGENVSQYVTKDRNKIELYNKTINKSKRHDREEFNDIQRHRQDNADGVSGKLSSLDKQKGDSDEKTTEHTKRTDRNSTGSMPSAESNGPGGSVDGDSTSVSGEQSNSGLDNSKSTGGGRTSSDEHNEGVHQLHGEKDADSNTQGNQGNRSNVNSESRGINTIREKLRSELELVFDIANQISDNAKVLKRYYDAIGKEQVLNICSELGYNVSTTNKDGIINISPKETDSEPSKEKGLRVFSKSENKLQIGLQYREFTEKESTNDFSVIEYKGQYAVIYAEKEIEALCDDLTAATKYMHEEQGNLYKEVGEAVDLFGNPMKSQEGQPFWKKTYRHNNDTDYPHQIPTKEIKKDLKDYSIALAKELGLEHYTDRKGKKQYVNVNIAPAGGNATIVLWKPNTEYGIYINIGFTPDYSSGGYNNYKAENEILWRVTTKSNVWTGKQNQYAKIDVNPKEFKLIAEHQLSKYLPKENLKEDTVENVNAEPTEYFSQIHSKTKKTLHTVSIDKDYRLSSEEFKQWVSKARTNGGYYSRYSKDGMKPGFIFKTIFDATEFQKELNKYINGKFNIYTEAQEKIKAPIENTDKGEKDVKQETVSQVEETTAKKENAPSKDIFINGIKERIDKSDKIKNTPELRKIAQNAGLLAGEHYTDIKHLYDIASNALNQYIIENAEKFKATKESSPEKLEEIITELDRLQDLLPTETERSFDTIALQQFSTPLSLSFITNLVAEVGENDRVLEPSAGEGNLTVFSLINGATVIANEIDPTRKELLERLGISKITTEDAKHIHAILKEDNISTVAMNPPFSRDVKKGNKMETGTGRKHVESALEKMLDGGRLVAIVGKGMSMDSPTNKEWWDGIKKRFDVKANILIDGHTYRKKGTTFDNRLVVVDRTGPTKETLEASVDSYKELLQVITGISNKQKISYGQETRTEKLDSRENINAGKQQSTNRSDADSDIRRKSNSEAERQPATSDRRVDIQVKPEINELHPRTDGRNDITDSRADISGNKPNDRKTNDGVPGDGSNVRDSSPKQPKLIKREIGGFNILYNKKKIENQSEKVGYDTYKPEIWIEGSKAHPAQLVESTAMASVNLPQVSYAPSLEKSIIEKGALSEAQLEDVILAGAAMNKKLADGKTKGFFLGAGTGYGKGRTIAAMILDSINKGHGNGKAIWLSKNENAHYDSKDYWKEIGGDEKKIIKKVKAKQQINHTEGVLLATYGTLSNKYEANENERVGYWHEETPQSRIQQIVQWLGKDYDGIIVFDEAHLMGNAIQTKAERGTKKPSQRALAGVALQDLLPNAKFVYSSATGATEVMNLAYATRLGLWGDGTAFDSVHSFINTIDSSGVAGMELVSRDLKAMGLYTAKSLSFDGVKYETLQHKLYPEQKDLYNKVAKAWQLVLQNINDAIEANNTSTKKRTAVMSSFWGAHQRFFQQIITTMQMPTLIESIAQDMEEGRASIIQLVNTNEAATERELAEKKAAAGDLGIDYESLELSPKNILIEYIKKGFPTQLYESQIDGRGNEVQVAVTDSEGNPVENPIAVIMRDGLIKDINENIHLPEAPLDIIINQFGVDNVAEVTGRSKRIVLKDTEDNKQNKVEERRTKSNVSKDKDDFMDGKKNILVFSEAGGTGASFHADKTKNNQKQRVHYVLQAGWKADAAVQGFGRSHRSNQAIEPIFKLVTTDLKAQRRFLSSIAKRLDQLGALTKGQRQTGGQGILDGSFNLEGQYAKQALFEFYQDVEAERIPGVDMNTLETQMALKIYNEDEDGNREYNQNVIFNSKMFLNRLMSLEIDVMDRVFESYMEHIEDQVNRAKKQGTYDEGIEIVKAISTNVTSETLINKDKETGADTYLTELELEVKNEKSSFADILKNMERFGDRFKGFAKRENSDKVYAIVKQMNGKIDGNIETIFRRFSVITDSIVEERDFREKYRPVDITDAKVLWNKEYQEYPDTRKKTETIVKGSILPIWSNLPKGGSVRRYIDDSGTPHLGKYYGKKDVLKIRKTFNAINKLSYSTAQVIKALSEGGKCELANEFILESKKHQGIKEIAVKVDVPFSERYRLEQAGATFKIGNGLGTKGEFYISFNNAEQVIENILKKYGTTIVSAEDKDGNPLKAESNENNQLQKEEKSVEEVGYRTVPPQMNTLFDNINKVIDLDYIKFYENYNSGEYGDAFMRLNVEKQEIYEEDKIKGINMEGAYKIVMSQNYIQEGDMMDDPRIDVAVLPSIGAAYPLDYQQHGFGERYERFIGDGTYKKESVARFKDVMKFMNSTWLPNLVAQGRTIKDNRLVHQMSIREFEKKVFSGKIDFDFKYNLGKAKIQEMIKILNDAPESKKEEYKNTTSELIKTEHLKCIDIAISENKYIPSKAKASHKKFEQTVVSFYKSVENLSLDEFLKAEIINVKGVEIKGEENSNKEFVFKTGEGEIKRTKEQYNKMQNPVKRDDILAKWIDLFEKGKFEELAENPLLKYSHFNSLYANEFCKYLKLDKFPPNLDKPENRKKFISLLNEIHKDRFGKSEGVLFAKRTVLDGILEAKQNNNKNKGFKI